MDSGRSREAAAANGAAGLAWPAGKVCTGCYNAGWVKDGYELIKCPQCRGASIVERDSKATKLAWIARDRSETARIRREHGLPPLGQEMEGNAAAPQPQPVVPPEGFASAAAIPNTEREDRMQAARAEMHRQIAALAKKMKGGAT